MRLVVVIPCLNEAATISDVIARIPASVPGVSDIRVVVVDDGSTDQSAKLAEDAGAVVVSNGSNRGLGYTFRHGLHKALELGADIVVNMDGDGQFDPQDIRRLVAPIVAGTADFVTASRFKDSQLIPDMPPVKLWGNRFMSRMISTMLGERFYDVSCGFRAYSREAALRLHLWGKFTYTQESFLDLAVKDMRITEVPVRVLGVRPVGESRIASNLWKYGVQTANIIFRSYRDYWPFRFFMFVSIPLFTVAICLLLFFTGHYALTGRFSPHVWAGFTGAGTMAGAFGLLSIGFFADMLKRIRLNQEEIIYMTRANGHRTKDRIACE